MAKRGLVILLPLRVRPTEADFPDLTITMPELSLPPFPTEQGGTTAPPPPPPTTTPPPTTQGFPVIDIVDQLPRVPANDDWRGSHAKDKITFHWEGSDAIASMSDAQTVEWIKGIAQQHINKDWGNGNFGGGIMYHEVIAQSGTSFNTRFGLDILWHAGNDEANLTSRAILVVCSAATPMTEAQVNAVIARQQAFAQQAGGTIPTYPHSAWSATACPGDQIRSLIANMSGGYRG